MKTLMKMELRQTRKMLLIWLTLVLMLAGFCYFEFLSLKDSLGEMSKLMDAFPRILLVMFGVKADLSTPVGWYCCLYFWVAILAFAYALYLGITCVAKEERWNTSEYLFSKPVKRTQIVHAKVLACAVNLLIYAVFSGLCSFLMIVLSIGGLERNIDVFFTTLGMYLTQMILFSIGLFIAAVVKKYRFVVRVGALVMLLAYGLSIVIQYMEADFWDFLSPLCYFDAYGIIMNGFRLPYLILTVVVVFILVWAADKQWRKREFI